MISIPCPHCGGAINPAAMLGKMTAGKKKKLSAAEREARSKRMAVARRARWPAD